MFLPTNQRLAGAFRPVQTCHLHLRGSLEVANSPCLDPLWPACNPSSASCQFVRVEDADRHIMLHLEVSLGSRGMSTQR
jgi:hypothetical protein